MSDALYMLPKEAGGWVLFLHSSTIEHMCLLFALMDCWLESATLQSSRGLLLCKSKDARVVSKVQKLHLARVF